MCDVPPAFRLKRRVRAVPRCSAAVATGRAAACTTCSPTSLECICTNHELSKALYYLLKTLQSALTRARTALLLTSRLALSKTQNGCQHTRLAAVAKRAAVVKVGDDDRALRLRHRPVLLGHRCPPVRGAVLRPSSDSNGRLSDPVTRGVKEGGLGCAPW